MPRVSTVVGLTLLVLGLAASASAQAHKLEYAQDGSGVFGYKDTPLQPWSGFHVHDPDRPAPPKVDPGKPCTPAEAGRAPSDAVVLFDGRDTSAWKPADWTVENGELVAARQPLVSQAEFGDCQIHVEWSVPVEESPNIMNSGNNGVFLMGRYEIQIFDSYRVKLYPDGQAGAVYAQTPPRVNACRPPGEWEAFDIVFVAPRYEGEKIVAPGRVTVLHNGLLLHHDQEVYGSTAHLILPQYGPPQEKGPLVLGAHGCPVRFRNIWVRPLE